MCCSYYKKCIGGGKGQDLINYISDDLNEFGHFCHNGDNTFCNKTQFGEPVYKKTLAHRNYNCKIHLSF